VYIIIILYYISGYLARYSFLRRFPHPPSPTHTYHGMTTLYTFPNDLYTHIHILFDSRFILHSEYVCEDLWVLSGWERGEKNRLIVLYECVCITIMLYALWYYVYRKKIYYGSCRSKLSHLRVMLYALYIPSTPGRYIYYTGCADNIQLTIITWPNIFKYETLRLFLFFTRKRVWQKANTHHSK